MTRAARKLAATGRRWLTGPEVDERMGFSRYTRRRLVKAGDFPAPVKRPGLQPRWSVEEVERWERNGLDERMVTP